MKWIVEAKKSQLASSARRVINERRRSHDWPSKPNLKMPICPGLAAMVICTHNWQGTIDDATTAIELDPNASHYFRRGWMVVFRTISTVRSRTTRSRSASNPITGRRTIIGAGHTTSKQQFELALQDANYVLEKREPGTPP